MPWTRQLPETIDPELAACINHAGSMTARLKAAADQQFSVKVLNEQWLDSSTLCQDEKTLLNLTPNEKVKLREVHLLVDEVVWVYGRTLFPEATLLDEKTHLQGLGAKPLGEILFNDPTTERQPFSFCCLSADEPLYLQATVGLAISNPLWARRSLFVIQSRPLLLTEVFLNHS